MVLLLHQKFTVTTAKNATVNFKKKQKIMKNKIEGHAAKHGCAIFGNQLTFS